MMQPRNKQRGFTLTELMIVVAIIGLLAALAIPAFVRARTGTLNSRYMGDLRVARNAFIMYCMDEGQYPADTTPAIMPTGMNSYLGRFPWTSPTILGGSWDWDYGVFGVVAGVSVHQPSVDAAQLTKLDASLDDGDLSTGSFRSRANGYISILE